MDRNLVLLGDQNRAIDDLMDLVREKEKNKLRTNNSLHMELEAKYLGLLEDYEKLQKQLVAVRQGFNEKLERVSREREMAENKCKELQSELIESQERVNELELCLRESKESFDVRETQLLGQISQLISAVHGSNKETSVNGACATGTTRENSEINNTNQTIRTLLNSPANCAINTPQTTQGQSFRSGVAGTQENKNITGQPGVLSHSQMNQFLPPSPCLPRAINGAAFENSQGLLETGSSTNKASKSLQSHMSSRSKSAKNPNNLLTASYQDMLKINKKLVDHIKNYSSRRALDSFETKAISPIQAQIKTDSKKKKSKKEISTSKKTKKTKAKCTCGFSENHLAHSKRQTGISIFEDCQCQCYGERDNRSSSKNSTLNATNIANLMHLRRNSLGSSLGGSGMKSAKKKKSPPNASENIQPNNWGLLTSESIREISRKLKEESV